MMLIFLYGVHSYNVVMLTKAPGQDSWSANSDAEKDLDNLSGMMPDTKECCKQQNITHQR